MEFAFEDLTRYAILTTSVLCNVKVISFISLSDRRDMITSAILAKGK